MSLLWLRTWQVGIKSLLLHPLRSLLTVLGIFIGVAAVIWLLAIGEGISRKAQEQIESLGGKFLDVKNSVVNTILSGWQMGSTVTIQSGFPIIISGASDGALIARPDRVEGVPLEVPKELQKWYDGNQTVTLPNGRVIKPSKNTFLKYYTGAWQGRVVTLPNGKYGAAQSWYGSSAPTFGDFTGPGRFNIDMSLRRSIKMYERYSLEISAESTNVLNHAEMSGSYTANLGNTTVTPNAAIGLQAGMEEAHAAAGGIVGGHLALASTGEHGHVHEEELGVGEGIGVRPILAGQLLKGVLADRLKHAVARLSIMLVSDHQAFFD